MKPRVLFLSTSIPPAAESQTIRNIYLLRGLGAAGFAVDIVAPAHAAGDASLLELLPSGVAIHRTEGPLYDRVQQWITRLPLGGLRPHVRSGVATAAGYLVAPDVRRDWADAALSAARALPTRPDLIVSSSGSSAAHLAAAKLAEEWACPWIAELGDPWSFNPIPPASLPHIRWQNLRLERRALRHCSLMTVTTDETAAVYRRGWPRKPVHVLPCGFTRLPAELPAATSPARDIRIAYVGTAARGTRDLRYFLNALAALPADLRQSVEFRIIGSYSPAFSREAASLGLQRVSFTGWVSYYESIQAMRSADLLLLYGNAVPLQVPGKVFNYIASGRPIMYLGQLHHAVDPTYRLLEPLPGVACHAAADPQLSHHLENVLGKLDALRVDAERREAMPELDIYDWDVIAEQFGELARAAIRPAAPGRTGA